jgi:hypothetical protein
MLGPVLLDQFSFAGKKHFFASSSPFSISLHLPCSVSLAY